MTKLGIIGLSKGNGHPFSWPAIINGDFNKEILQQAEIKYSYIGIHKYLDANRDTLGFDDAKVTHIWTQDRDISEHIARASFIDNVADNIEDMVGCVDAVILARDDPENHVAMASHFLDADIPIFIDKPLAITTEDLNYFTEQQAVGKFVMSCSSFRYSSENKALIPKLASLGKIELATAVGKKDWIKYGVHMLEGLFALLDDPKVVSVRHVNQKSGKDIVYIEFETGLVATIHLFMDIAATFQLSLFGCDGWRIIEYKNWYSMFRNTITEFIGSVQESKPRLLFKKTENIIKTLIAAQDSLLGGGKTIKLE